MSRSSIRPQQHSSLVNRLARMSDQTVARLLRQSHRLVRRRTASRRSPVSRWSLAEDRLLGQWPDARVARFLGRTAKSVQSRRLKLGRRFASPARPWTEEEDRLIAPRNAQGPIKQWTGVLARRLGRSVVAVRGHRRLKYGAVFPPGQKWTRREVRLLGKHLDREVATLTGRTYATVQVTRCALGIASYRARKKFRWTPARERLLGTQPDRVFAERLDCSCARVKLRRRELGIPAGGRRRWTRAEERLVETALPAREVARRIGRSLRAVRHRRHALSRRTPVRAKAHPGKPRPPYRAR